MPYYFYDDPICDSSFVSGAEPFDVQEAGNCFRELAASECLITHARIRFHTGGGSEDHKTGR